MITLPMTVSGFGDLYNAFFNAIALTFGTSTYASLLRLSILLAGFSVLASLVLHRDLFAIIKWLFYFYLLIYVGFVPKATLEINDLVNRNKPYRIANVPLGLALVASISSEVSFTLTQLMEMNFTMPEDLTYHQTGMIFAAQLMKAATQFEITDPIMDANMQGFIKQCVFYDLKFGKYSLKELVESKDIWGFLELQSMSPVRGFIYTYPDKKTTMLTCKEAFPILTGNWKGALTAARNFYGGRLFAQDKTPAVSLGKYLPIGVGFLANIADAQADQIMKQTMMGNAISRGTLHMGAAVNADAALKAYSYVRAQSQKRMTNQTVGEMACYWLPLIKISLELILYGAFIFVVLIAVFPFGQRSLKGYLATLTWVQLWPPVFALFHLIISYYGRTEMSSALTTGITMQTLSSMEQIASDMVGLAGYLSMSVPAVAGFILWGAHHNFAQLSQYIGGVTQSASSQAATEVASGNISLGNTSFGNHNAFNTNSNKYDTNMRLAGGAHGFQLADGTQLTAMADGGSVINMQGAISSTGIGIDLTENYRASFTKSAESAESAVKQQSHSFGHATTSVARGVNSLSHHYSQMEADGESWNQQSSTGISHAFSEIEKTNKDIQERFGLSHQEAESLTSSLYAEGKAGANWSTPSMPGKIFSASAGIGGGLSRNSSHNNSNSSSHVRDEAKSIMDSHHYAENIDLVTRAIHDKSFRTGDETGDRLVSDISRSFDSADHSRNELNANQQKADYFRKAASLASEKGSGFRDNLSQEFVEFIGQQPNQHGTRPIGVANVNGILKDAHLRERYANLFLQEKVSEINANWQHGLADSSQKIHAIHHANNSGLGDDRHINAINLSNQHELSVKADEKNLSLEKSIDHSVKKDVNNQFVDYSKEVNDRRNQLHEEKESEANTHHQVTSNYKRDGKLTNIIFGVGDKLGGKNNEK